MLINETEESKEEEEEKEEFPSGTESETDEVLVLVEKLGAGRSGDP